MTNKDNDPHIR